VCHGEGPSYLGSIRRRLVVSTWSCPGLLYRPEELGLQSARKGAFVYVRVAGVISE
jgi:hypothetical protein